MIPITTTTTPTMITTTMDIPPAMSAIPATSCRRSADPAYCAQRYKSYDPASGTYLGYDGLRHPCGQ